MAGNFSDDLKKILYAGVGAVATVTEKAGEVIEQLVKKGEMTVEQGRAFNEELRHKVEDAMRAQPDVSQMTPEERAALRRQLDEADASAKDEDDGCCGGRCRGCEDETEDSEAGGGENG